MKQNELAQTYQLYARDVFLYALALCKEYHMAEDLTSDTFYKALLSLDGKSGSVKYWLLHVCKNLFLDLCRKKQREPVALHDVMAEGNEGPLDLILKQEARRELYRALLRLSDADRELLTLFYFLDCSIVDMAAHLGRSAGVVKTGLSRARVRLKKQLEEEGL